MYMCRRYRYTSLLTSPTVALLVAGCTRFCFFFGGGLLLLASGGLSELAAAADGLLLLASSDGLSKSSPLPAGASAVVWVCVCVCVCVTVVGVCVRVCRGGGVCACECFACGCGGSQVLTWELADGLLLLASNGLSESSPPPAGELADALLLLASDWRRSVWRWRWSLVAWSICSCLAPPTNRAGRIASGGGIYFGT